MTANDLRIGDRIQTNERILIITDISSIGIFFKEENGFYKGTTYNECVNKYFQDGTWKLIPAVPDILSKLREALGWQEGSMEEILAVLRACKGFYDLTEIKTDKEYARREHAVMVNLNHAVHKIK